MSLGSTVDERVVSMGFNNKLFERNVKESMGTLDRLKDKLNFSGVANSLNKAMGTVNTETLTGNLSKVKEGFTGLEIAAIAAIANITNKVVDLGLQLVKSLSIDNISAGWTKYGQKTQSVATLMAQGLRGADGELLNDADKLKLINDQLELLTFYADETSYSFTDMLSNITKFTGAGVSLEKATQAMIGSSNWAALSGQDAGTAARVQLQLSQAMGVGAMTLIDWKSIQNANMATEEFKQKAIDAAVEAGSLIQSIDGTYMTMDGLAVSTSNFRETLSKRWFTSDVLLEVLNEYGEAAESIKEVVDANDDIDLSSQAYELLGDEVSEFAIKAYKAAQEAKTLKQAIDATKEAVETGWTNIFTYIFGDLDEAKALWTQLALEFNEIFVKNLQIKGEIFKEWHAIGGRDDLFGRSEEGNGAFWNLLDVIKQIRDIFQKSWNTIFPLSEFEEEGAMVSDVAQKLKSLTERLKEASKSWSLNEGTAEAFSNILKGVFSIVKLSIHVLGKLWDLVSPLVKFILKLSGGLLLALSKVGEGITKFVDAIINPIKMVTVSFVSLRRMNPDKTITNLGNSLEFVGKKIVSVTSPTTKLTRIAAGLGAVFQILKGFAVALGNSFNIYLLPIFEKLFGVAGGGLGAIADKLVSWFAKVGDSLVEFNKKIQANNSIQNGFDKVASFFKTFFKTASEGTLGDAITIFNRFAVGIGAATLATASAFEKLKEALYIGFASAFPPLTEAEENLNPIVELFKGIASVLIGLFAVVKKLLPMVSSLVTYIGVLLQQLGDKLAHLFDGEGGIGLTKIFDVAFWAFIAWRLTEFAEYFADIMGAINGAFKDLGGAAEGFEWEKKTAALQNVGSALLMIVVALVLLASLDADALSRAMDGLQQVGMLMVVLLGALKLISGTAGPIGIKSLSTAYSLNLLADAMVKMGVALLIFVGALLILSTMPQDKMVNGIMGLGIVMTAMIVLAKRLSKHTGALILGATGMTIMGIAVNAMVFALKRIGQMNQDEITKGLLGMTGLLALSMIFAQSARFVKKANRTAKSLVVFAAALAIASIPLKTIGKMSLDEIRNGLIGMTGLAGIMMTMAMLSRYSKKAIITAVGLGMMGTSLSIFAVSIKIFNSISWEGLAKATVAIIGLVGMLYLVHKFGTTKFVTSIGLFGVALSFLGVGLTSFAISMRALGSIPWKNIWTALGVLVLLVSTFSLASGLFGVISPLILGFGVSLIFLSSGLILFATGLRILGGISIGGIFKSILALVVVLGALALASNYLLPMIPAMLALSVTLALLGAGIFLLALGVTMLAPAMGLLAVTLGPVLQKLIDTIIEKGPAFINALGDMIKNALTKTLELMPEFELAITAILIALGKILINSMPIIVEALGVLISGIIDLIVDKFPEILVAVFKIIGNLLEGLKNEIGNILTMFVDVLIELLKALADKAPEFIAQLVETVMILLEALITTIVDAVPRIVNAVFDLVLGIIDGLGIAIEENADLIGEAMWNFGKHMLKAFLKFWGINSPSRRMIEIAGFLIQGIVKGLKDKAKNAIEQMKILGNDIKEAISNKVSEFYDIGKNIVMGMVNGIKDFISEVRSTIEEMADDLPKWVKKILGIHSPSRVFADIGKHIDEGLMVGMKKNQDIVKDTAEGLGDQAVEGVEGSGLSGIMKTIYDMLTGEFDGSIVIRPVLDMSEIQNGANRINGMLGNVSVGGTSDIAYRASEGIKRNRSQGVSNNTPTQQTTENITVENTFNINGGNAKDIAKQISREINNSIDRRKAVWAK